MTDQLLWTMLRQLLWIMSSSSLVIIVFCTAEVIAGKFKFHSLNDSILDLGTFAFPELVVSPLVIYVVAAITTTLLPGDAGALAGTSIWIQIIAFLLLDDMVSYWYHRATHTFPWLWYFHMAHHTPTYMSASITRRNSYIYLIMHPNLYLVGILIYLSFGDTFIWYIAVKNTVLTAAHSAIRWDSFLYRYEFLKPIAWVIQRTISTPATHCAHHATREDDGIGHFNGNYTVLLFLWDVLFGTARITQQYPPEFGVPVDPVKGPEPWFVQLLYPLFSPSRQPAAAPLDIRPTSEEQYSR
ncbi:sterol desaturase/sphingolipid hydroxylase (fatty acid hydroxylase superfamily) [Bradyrhizobium sp. USDA 4524]|uniref:sterol desaturase family protein n=1 Tax=unclassified Bradyrhizobium TaxID=2631580 RepID=UPI00209DC898|nr:MULTISPECIES: sterol desaturase family protein [unclassified Bradyrhizobium]MCP1845696.1 sterol desaturase/sphingolipid hydroxylase (fatty acid hydroxylase superfamily) [Bradyrhizobium sp. USDA 4538]MCP1906980.1 sterol desaturase/sphingolipid hydroxylase (fatty acid hydroxylase superfamily) [Bradyrhizobium sp. USDA 4537]MCP1985456.1 sterol desaturase/sphingolipid hydroxylase (fatty acid hydroxylase superfamily) [Bradyrhizobium sp. USDA 4539]